MKYSEVTAKQIGHGSYSYGAVTDTAHMLSLELRRLIGQRHYSLVNESLENAINEVNLELKMAIEDEKNRHGLTTNR